MDYYDDARAEFVDALAPAGLDVGAELHAKEEGFEERWLPTTDSDFEWVLAKRHEAKKRMNAASEHRAVMIRQLDAVLAKHAREADLFDDMLARGLAASGEQKKRLAGGTVYESHRQSWQWPSTDLDSYAALVEWAREHDALKVSESIDKTAIKSLAKETGELPPGVAVESVTSVNVREA